MHAITLLDVLDPILDKPVPHDILEQEVILHLVRVDHTRVHVDLVEREDAPEVIR